MIVNNQKGNAWLPLIGCLLVAGGIAFEVHNRRQAAKERSRLTALRDEAESVMEAIVTRLKNPEDCSELLAGVLVTAGDRTDVSLRFVPDPEADPGQKAIAAGSTVTASGIRLVQLQIEIPAEEDFRTEILDETGVPTELRRYPARLHASFAGPDGRPVEITRTALFGPEGGKEFHLGIPFFAWATPPPPISNGQIQSCFGPNTVGTLCNDLGGYFIPQNSGEPFPYEQSCRQSLKTLKRSGAALAPLANCRIGGLAAKPEDCKKYGVAFGASQINGRADITAIPGTQYLCQICQ